MLPPCTNVLDRRKVNKRHVRGSVQGLEQRRKLAKKRRRLLNAYELRVRFLVDAATQTECGTETSSTHASKSGLTDRVYGGPMSICRMKNAYGNVRLTRAEYKKLLQS
jgi:hypothetical protein